MSASNPPLFTFLSGLTALQSTPVGRSAPGQRPGSALSELLGESFPAQLSAGARSLAALSATTASITGERFESESTALASLIDLVVESASAKVERGQLEGFTPDEAWLGLGQQTARGFRWNLQRDLITNAMIEELPKGHQDRVKWMRSRAAAVADNPVEIRSRILATVANETAGAAHRAWVTMREGFQPCLRGRLELIAGKHPALELRIDCSGRDRAVFRLFERRLRGQGSRRDLFSVCLSNSNFPKRVRLSLSGIPDRRTVRLGWAVLRAWIETVQQPPEMIAAAGARHAWRRNAKVRRLGIKDPFLGLLIAKFDNAIDWSNGRIPDEQTLRTELSRHLLPGLRAELRDACDLSNYNVDLDKLEVYFERESAIADEARFLASMIEEGISAVHVTRRARTLLALILKEKIERLRSWERYLTRGNPLYRKSPAFQFIVLHFVLHSSPLGQESPPLALDEEALARLYGAIASGAVPTEMNLKNLYTKLQSTDAEEGAAGGATRWLVFKGVAWRDEAHILAREAQDSGWCIAEEVVAGIYLRDESYFHVLKVSGRARVALAVKGDRIVETQGPRNQDPGSHWPRVLLYAALRRLAFSNSERWWRDHRTDEAREAAEEGCAQIGGLDPAALAIRLRDCPHDVQFASAAQIGDPRYHDIIATAWRAVIEELPAAAALAPEGLGRDAKLRGQWERKVARQAVVDGDFQWTF